jgi:lipopolysaccharide biosynthesis protein
MNQNHRPPARLIAFYLPQFHPIPENDLWWGTGFTEWTNAAKARPLFRGHYQPHLPRDLGFYDLRCPETRVAQASLAKQHGVEAFCYYHYWFAGRRLLQRPFEEVLISGSPDYPFCLCWANGSWTGIWHGAPDRVLIEQTYPGGDDYAAHFLHVAKAFHDPRYVRVDGKPLFLVYAPRELPDAGAFSAIWRQLAEREGLPGLYLVGVSHNDAWDPRSAGFDASMLQKLPPRVGRIPIRYPLLKMNVLVARDRFSIYEHRAVSRWLMQTRRLPYDEFSCVIPNWDNTPRSSRNGLVLHESTPQLFQEQLQAAIDQVAGKPADRRLIFLKSWNEWAEGNHLEPDMAFGTRFLEAIARALASRASID